MFFDLSWSHILLLLVVTLVVVGPKDLPRMMRMAGRWTGKARAMANQLRRSFDEMARQSELEELRAEIQALRTQQPLVDVDHALQQPVLPPETLAAAEATHADAHTTDAALAKIAVPEPEAPVKP